MSLDRVIRLVAILVALVGLWILLESPSMGMGAANGFLRSRGGSMDTATFLAVAQAQMDSYRVLGGILLAVGSFRALQRP